MMIGYVIAAIAAGVAAANCASSRKSSKDLPRARVNEFEVFEKNEKQLIIQGECNTVQDASRLIDQAKSEYCGPGWKWIERMSGLGPYCHDGKYFDDPIGHCEKIKR